MNNDTDFYRVISAEPHEIENLLAQGVNINDESIYHHKRTPLHWLRLSIEGSLIAIENLEKDIQSIPAREKPERQYQIWREKTIKGKRDEIKEIEASINTKKRLAAALISHKANQYTIDEFGLCCTDKNRERIWSMIGKGEGRLSIASKMMISVDTVIQHAKDRNFYGRESSHRRVDKYFPDYFRSGSTTAIRLAITAGVDVNFTDDLRSALHIVCEGMFGSTKTKDERWALMTLLENGASPHTLSPGKFGKPPLFNVGEHDVYWAVGPMVKFGADPNWVSENTGWTALHQAAEAGSIRTVKELLKYGADPSIKDDWGRTPRDMAAEELAALFERQEEALSVSIEMAQLSGCETEEQIKAWISAHSRNEGDGQYHGVPESSMAEYTLERNQTPQDIRLAEVISILDAWANKKKNIRTGRTKRTPDFRHSIMEAYSCTCAVSGFKHTKKIPLEAAHIFPISSGGGNETSNGILLRHDLHKLFDRGLMWITAENTIQFSKEILDQEDYLSFIGKPLTLPINSSHAPNSDYFAWHRVSHGRI